MEIVIPQMHSETGAIRVMVDKIKKQGMNKKLIQTRYKLFLDAFVSRVSGHRFAEWE